MSAMKCAVCGADKPSPDSADFSLLDYCAQCGDDLCREHMEQGCCGHQPALSGIVADENAASGNPDPEWSGE